MMTADATPGDASSLDDWMTLSEAATELGLTRNRMWQLVHTAGGIPGLKKGERWLVRRADVLAYKDADRRPGRRADSN